MLDLLIRGGDVVDPKRKTRTQQNVGVKDGKIAFVSEREADAQRVNDAVDTPYAQIMREAEAALANA